MKKVISFMFAMFCFSFIYAQRESVFGMYGIQNLSQKDMQAYVGKEVYYYPASPLTKPERDFDLPFNSGDKLIIESITNVNNNGKIKIKLRTVDGRNSESINVYTHPDSNVDEPDQVCFLPLVFSDIVDKEKNRCIGNEFQDFHDGSIYKVIDFGLENNTSFIHIVPTYYLENVQTKEQIKYHSYYQIEKDAWSLSVTHVEKDGNADEVFNSKPQLGMSFQDENIKIDFSERNHTGLLFSITNLSKSTIKIVWNDAALVNSSGNMSKIIHDGVKYSEKNESLVPTSIIRGVTLNEVVVPVDYVYYDDNQKDWTINPFYSHENENIMFMLPIKINDNIIEYLFTFETLFNIASHQKIVSKY